MSKYTIAVKVVLSLVSHGLVGGPIVTKHCYFISFILPPPVFSMASQTGQQPYNHCGWQGHMRYHVHQSCLPFLMLFDLVQQMYLLMANKSVEAPQSIAFYKGVMFLDSL